MVTLFYVCCTHLCTLHFVTSQAVVTFRQLRPVGTLSLYKEMSFTCSVWQQCIQYFPLRLKNEQLRSVRTKFNLKSCTMTENDKGKESGMEQRI
jgi:hypothetical protein